MSLFLINSSFGLSVVHESIHIATTHAGMRVLHTLHVVMIAAVRTAWAPAVLNVCIKLTVVHKTSAADQITCNKWESATLPHRAIETLFAKFKLKGHN